MAYDLCTWDICKIVNGLWPTNVCTLDICKIVSGLWPMVIALSIVIAHQHVMTLYYVMFIS